MKQTTNRIFTLILLIVFFIGLSVLLYPALSQYWNSKVQSKAVVDYERLIKDMSEEDYSAEWEKANAYNKKLAKLTFPLGEYKKLDKQYKAACNIGGNGIMGYISIDKLQLEIPIYHGADDAVLNIACGHFEGSSLPVGGESTHSVIMAHRGLPHAKLFTNLDKMQVGDSFVINVLGEELTYEVVQVKIVLPDDISDVQIVKGEDYCTLVTCTPYGINTHRLLVQGTRIETIRHREIYITSDAYLVDRVIVTPVVAMPIIFVLIVIVVFKPVKKKFNLKNFVNLEEDELE
ncbi:MAG: class C sortase [Clostridia bacterium]|nr:class C sortase [Clostridia bacterium]